VRRAAAPLFAGGGADAGAVRVVDSTHPMFGKRLTVRGVPLTRGGGGGARYSSLKVFAEPGDPSLAGVARARTKDENPDRYGPCLPYVLAHGDAVTVLDFRDFAGQSWVLHEVDETARGLTAGGRPPAAATYLAWSHMDFQGHRWLVDD